MIEGLDHLVLTVRDLATTRDFYTRVLGLTAIQFAEGRWALRVAAQKINLHQADRPVEPHASRPTPGSADLCFLTPQPIETVVAHLHACAVPIVAGPVERQGAVARLQSIYLRDPDGNLIEIANSLPPVAVEQL